MSTYDPFTAARRMATPPPCVTYVATRLDGGGYFARCDGCRWDGAVMPAATDALVDAAGHTFNPNSKGTI